MTTYGAASGLKIGVIPTLGFQCIHRMLRHPVGARSSASFISTLSGLQLTDLSSQLSTWYFMQNIHSNS